MTAAAAPSGNGSSFTARREPAAPPQDATVLDAIAWTLATSRDWSADELTVIADLIGTVRPHPGELLDPDAPDWVGQLAAYRLQLTAPPHQLRRDHPMNPERCDRRINAAAAAPSRLTIAHMYTRADAITDRLLVEVPPSLIRLYRLPWPVAVTAQAWADVIAWPTAPQRHESEEGRLLDVLVMAKASIESWLPNTEYPLTIWRVPPTKPAHPRRPVRLVLSLHEGDSGETVATIAHRPRPSRWWLPHLYAAAGTAAVMALGWALAALTNH